MNALPLWDKYAEMDSASTKLAPSSVCVKKAMKSPQMGKIVLVSTIIYICIYWTTQITFGFDHCNSCNDPIGNISKSNDYPVTIVVLIIHPRNCLVLKILKQCLSIFCFHFFQILTSVLVYLGPALQAHAKIWKGPSAVSVLQVMRYRMTTALVSSNGTNVLYICVVHMVEKGLKRIH